METFYFEVTDTFGSELNYCWLNRFTIKAKNLKGALIKLSRYTGLNFRNNGLHYKAKRACIAAYELEWEVNQDWIERSEAL
jgi:hypothetical protein